jgi:hypothetical protein
MIAVVILVGLQIADLIVSMLMDGKPKSNWSFGATVISQIILTILFYYAGVYDKLF